MNLYDLENEQEDKIDLSKVSENTLLNWFHTTQKSFHSYENEYNNIHLEENELLFPYEGHHNNKTNSLHTSFYEIKKEMSRRNIHFLRKWERKLIRKIKSQKRLSFEEAKHLFINLKNRLIKEIKSSLETLNDNIHSVLRKRLIAMF